MTGREKIKEILKQAQEELHRMFYEGVMRVRNGELRSFSTSDLNAIKPYDDIYADAFIAAGFGDVREYKHRAEVAERALRKYTRKVNCSRCPYAMSCDIFPPTPQNDYIECFDEVLRLERKEIAEEQE